MANMKVYIHPDFGNEADPGHGGVRRAVELQKQWFPEYGIDVQHTPDGADLALIHIEYGATDLARLTNMPVVADNHGLYWAEYEWPAWALKANVGCLETIRQADAVVVHSNWVADAVRRHTMRDVTVIPFGVEPDEWPVSVEYRPYVLWNKTRPDPVCDPEPVEHLAEMLPEVQFITTFRSDNDTVTPENMKVTGRLPYKEAKFLVQAAGVYLATTRETFGIGTLEAMASGVPVVGWRWGGQAEFLEHQVNAWLADPGDYDSLAEGVRWALANRTMLSKRGREVIEQRFTAERVMQQYAEFLENVRLEWQVARAKTAPRTSIIVTCYNLAQYLPDCLDSVLAQDDPNWECIVVDDASTDHTAEVVARYQAQDKRIKGVTNKHNQYLSGARNTGIERSKGRYVLPLDADDMLTPAAVGLLANALDNDRSIHISYGGVLFTNEDGRTLTDYRTAHGPGHSGWPMPFKYEWQEQERNLLPYCSMFRRDVWRLTGGYRRRCRTAEDADFWLRASSYGFRPAMITEADTLIYRNRPNSMSREVGGRSWASWFAWYAHPGLRPAGALTEKQGPVHSCAPPFVSVIIPVGPDHVHLVADAVDSLDAQSLRQWQCIVVNDSGRPLTNLPVWAKVVCADETCPCQDGDSCHYVDLPGSPAMQYTPRGVAHARNVGATHATARLLMPLDADDYLQPDALKVMYAVWDEQYNPDTIIYSDWYDEKVRGTLEHYETPNYDAHLLTQDGCIHAVTALYPRKVWEAVGGFNEEIPNWEDWGLQLEAAKQGICSVRVPVPLFVYRKYTGARREENYAQFERGKQGILDRYGEYFSGGGKELLGCSTCGGGQATPSAVVETPPQDPGDAVLLEYVGQRQGSVPLRGPSGTVYTFGGGADRLKYVHEHDVEFLLSMEGYRRAEVGPALEVDTTRPLVAEGPPAYEPPPAPPVPEGQHVLDDGYQEPGADAALQNIPPDIQQGMGEAQTEPLAAGGIVDPPVGGVIEEPTRGLEIPPPNTNEADNVPKAKVKEPANVPPKPKAPRKTPARSRRA